MSKIVLQARNEYLAEQEVGSNDRFRFYRASSSAFPGRELMLKIVKEKVDNGALDREAFVLSLLAQKAEEIERVHAAERPGEVPPNYTIVFPTILESFVSKEQGARRVLILGFDASNTLLDLAPLSLIRTRDRVRLDPKTGAWVMGKLLKILVFAHSQNIKVGDLTEDNVLIVKKHHYVTVLNWSRAFPQSSTLSTEDVHEDLGAAASTVFRILGGDLATGTLPEDEQVVGMNYADFFTGLMNGAYGSAREAHSAFYQLVEAHWGREFHPYSVHPL